MSKLEFMDLVITLEDLPSRAQSLNDEDTADVLGGWGWRRSRRPRRPRRRNYRARGRGRPRQPRRPRSRPRGRRRYRRRW